MPHAHAHAAGLAAEVVAEASRPSPEIAEMPSPEIAEMPSPEIAEMLAEERRPMRGAAAERRREELEVAEAALERKRREEHASLEAAREAAAAERADGQAELEQWKALARSQLASEREALIGEIEGLRVAAGHAAASEQLARESAMLLTEREQLARERCVLWVLSAKRAR